MEKTDSLTLRAVSWSQDAESALARAQALSTGSAAPLRALVESGQAALLAACARDLPVLYLVMRVEDQARGREGVVLAAAGGLKGHDLTRALLPQLERLFASVGCASVRIQTARRGLMRKLAALGYAPTPHVVFRKALA
jgi:hypothetical protein